MTRRFSSPETSTSRFSSTSATTMSDIHGPPDSPAAQSGAAETWAKVDQEAKITVYARAIQDQGNQDPLSAFERSTTMVTRDELPSTRLRKVNQHSIEGAFGEVELQGLNSPASPRAQPSVQVEELINAQALLSVEISDNNEHILNAPASTSAAVDSTDKHLPVAERQLSEYPQSPHLTASSSRPVTPITSIQEPDSGETRPDDAKFGVASPEDRSTLHEESHPQDALFDNSSSSDEDEHSSLSNSSHTTVLTILSGEVLKSQSTRPQDEIHIIADRSTPVNMPTTPTKNILPARGVQRGCMNGRVELPSYGGSDASGANFTERYELDPCPLSPGEVRSPIRGTSRKRLAMDDFPDKMRMHYSRQWEELCAKPRNERGVIDGYESGDSELDFSDWEDAKEMRRRKRRRL